MEYYDVIIVGAGIAGCGLAYNLKRIGYKGSVLVIDGRGVGANKGYGFRNTEKRIIEKYKLKYFVKFNGMKIGTEDETLFIVNHDYYFINYEKVCKFLLEKSKFNFVRAEAIKLGSNVLSTADKKFKFKYLIDCSGANFFLKKILKQPKPFRYWVGKVGVIPKIIKNFDRKYCLSQFGEEGFFEDLYPLSDKTLCGYWQYTKKIDHSLINPPKKTLLETYFPGQESQLIHNVVITNSPVFPIVKNNLAFLGDSFGNSLPSSAAGIEPILDSSKLLASAIKLDNLRTYQKEWKKKYMSSYLRFLVSRIDRYNNFNIIKKFKRNYPKNLELLKAYGEYPGFMEKVMANEKVNFKGLNIKFPPIQLFFLTGNFILLKIRYALMNLR